MHSLATDYFAPHFLRTSPYLLIYDRSCLSWPRSSHRTCMKTP